MTFDEIVEFVENRMRLSHIYQPLLIKSLVEAGGSATLRQLSLDFLAQDESQIIYYEDKIKSMPLRVLLKHGVVKKTNDLISLNAAKLTYEQKARIKMLCEKRLQEFVQKKGLGIWDYRMLDAESIPDSLRYNLLKESGGRCSLCGATKEERPLDVDHIIPRSRGGKTVTENLQVLCAKCNRSKGNKDTTDFRNHTEAETYQDCPFCGEKVKSRIVNENGTAIAVRDKYPVSKYHTLVLPRRHTQEFFTMTSKERRDAEDLLRVLRNEIAGKDSSITGFNAGFNCGSAAGQTICHAHIHLIPRRDGDTPNSRGGVRGVIPEKMSY
jgi:diadenosine tetraphosphate (Ap4A) HIT family hydrolase